MFDLFLVLLIALAAGYILVLIDFFVSYDDDDN